MTIIEEWLEAKSNQPSTLESWLITTPRTIFNPPLTPLKQQAIGEWYQACLTCYRTNKINAECGSEWLQLAYSYLQVMASDQRHSSEVRLWCLHRLDHLIVALLESPHQDSTAAEETISAHIAFMAGQQHQNLPNDFRVPPFSS